MAGTGAGRGTLGVRNPTAAQDQPCQPLHIQNIPSHSPCPPGSWDRECPQLVPSLWRPNGLYVGVPGRSWGLVDSVFGLLVYSHIPAREGTMLG